MGAEDAAIGPPVDVQAGLGSGVDALQLPPLDQPAAEGEGRVLQNHLTRMTAEDRKEERDKVLAAVEADPHAGPTALAMRIWCVRVVHRHHRARAATRARAAVSLHHI